MKFLKYTAYSLLLIGGLNWGMYGLSSRDLVDMLFGQIPVIARIVYVLVGLSALYIIFNRFTFCSCDYTCACSTDAGCACKDAGEIKPQS